MLGPEQIDAEVRHLRVQALLLKAGGQVLRARIHLMQNNAGEAQRQLRSAALTLATAADLADEETAARIHLLQTRLNSALHTMGSTPFVAPDAIETLWQDIQATIQP